MIEIGGFVGLAALVIGLFAWMRVDMGAWRAESKSDNADLRSQLKGDIGRLEGGIADLRSELKGDIAGLRSELKDNVGRLEDGIADLRSELKDDTGALREGQVELREGQAELRERMAKLEGLLDGLREAVTWRAGPRDAA